MDSNAGAHEIWVEPIHQANIEPPLLIGTWPVTGFGVARFGFSVPDNMASFVAARVVMRPRSSAASTTYSVAVSVSQDGLPQNQATNVQVNQPLSLTGNEMKEVEISGAMAALLGSPGRDYVSVLFVTPGRDVTTNHVLGSGSFTKVKLSRDPRDLPDPWVRRSAGLPSAREGSSSAPRSAEGKRGFPSPWPARAS